MADGNQIPTSPSAWKLYVAAGIGAFLLGVSDYMRHSTQSTVIALAGTLGVDQVWAFFLLTPILGFLAAWIYKPGTERDAFALGLAVFSLFALVPEQQTNRGITDKISVSPPPEQTGFNLGISAFAQESAARPASAKVILNFEGPPPADTTVSVENLTQGKQLGTFTIRDSLKLVGNPGDHIKLDFEAAGHKRTQVELPLSAADGVYQVQLQKSSTPLFLQRLVPAQAAKLIARPPS